MSLFVKRHYVPTNGFHVMMVFLIWGDKSKFSQKLICKCIPKKLLQERFNNTLIKICDF